MTQFLTPNPEFLHMAVSGLPEEAKNILLENPNTAWVVGGYLRAAYTGDQPNDVDIFFENALGAEKAEMYLRDIEHWTKVADTPNALTYKYDSFEDSATPTTPIQLVIHKYQPLDDLLLHDLDFNICQAALWWDGKGWQGKHTEGFQEGILNHQLVYLAPTKQDPFRTIQRLLKFERKGFKSDLESLGLLLGVLVGSLTRDELEYWETDEDRAIEFERRLWKAGVRS